MGNSDEELPFTYFGLWRVKDKKLDKPNIAENFCKLAESA